MKIILIEPFFTGSHKLWAEGYAANSSHEVTILSLPGRHWKWRMHGGAISLAMEFLNGKIRPDLFVATDMLDLSLFLSLVRRESEFVPAALYFHENQLTYPWSPADQDVQKKRDAHYAFINYTSALAADAVFFNSKYHRGSFLGELPKFLHGFPDYREPDSVGMIADKSSVLPLGLDLRAFDEHRVRKDVEKPLVLWNHRWEYDKNPEEFFELMETLSREGLDFSLAILGKNQRQTPGVFRRVKETLSKHIIHYGFCDSPKEYAKWLYRSSVLPVTSMQDFFGISVVEAIYCGCRPILPARLSYPEHIPPGLHSRFLYENGEQLHDLVFSILSGSYMPCIPLRDRVARYDWSQMAAVYDHSFEKIAGTAIPGGSK